MSGIRQIPLLDAQRLIERSQRQFEGGWAGPDYRHFTEQALEVLRPLYDDRLPEELIRTYQAHAPLDFLRMLSYRIPPSEELSPLVDRLADRRSVGILDYGCGLAHRTIAVACALRERGVAVQLTLVDLRRPWFVDFLAFLTGKFQIASTFVEIGPQGQPADLPAHDYCEVVNVLEHLPAPLTAVTAIDTALQPGGLLVASVDDQDAEMMHVTPNLKVVRDRLNELGYTRLSGWSDVSLFQKASP